MKNQIEVIEQNNAPAVEHTRATQEVQVMVIMAKKYPRDETACYNKIIQACKRPSLAKTAMYSYPRSGQQITGPSIRMAETLAKHWGNVEFGIVELSQENGISEVMAYAWDLESNTRQVKKFHVKHTRYSKSKGNTALIDPRDIYEIIANNAARRVRACILGVLPGDIVDSAISECEKTLIGDNKEPLIDKVNRCVAQFAQIGVTQKMIESKLLHSMEATNLVELVMLGKVFNSIRDKMSSIKDNFPDDVETKVNKQLDTSEEPKKIFKDPVASVEEVKEVAEGALKKIVKPEEELKELTEEEKAEIAAAENASE
jgi:predicted nucleotidyltransferase